MNESRWATFWSEFKRLMRHGPLTYHLWIGIVISAGLSLFMIVGAFADERLGKKALALLFATGFGVPAYLLARWLRSPEPASAHSAEIEFVRQPGDAPYFVAICKCGWVGGVVDTEDEARSDAERHTPTVDPHIHYPLGT